MLCWFRLGRCFYDDSTPNHTSYTKGRQPFHYRGPQWSFTSLLMAPEKKLMSWSVSENVSSLKGTSCVHVKTDTSCVGVEVLGYGAVWICRSIPTFPTNMLSPSSGAEVTKRGNSPWSWRYVSPKRRHRPAKTQDFYNTVKIAVKPSNII